MAIALREDVILIMLKKINEQNKHDKYSVDFKNDDFIGRELSIVDFLGHLDYLNQKHYLNTDFSNNADAKQEDIPDSLNSEKIDLRIANTFGASSAPLPHLIQFRQAKLTMKGENMLEQMENNPPISLQERTSVSVVARNTDFLERVAIRGGLPDIFDARDLTTIVYRTMRDLMTKNAAIAIESELHSKISSSHKSNLQQYIADLWRDNNSIVTWLSNFRPPLKFDGDTFILRIEQEGGLPSGTSGEKVIKSVFAATKEKLSTERIQEIAQVLPGKVKEMWEVA